MKILYGVVGEGMGHAMRSRVVLEHLLAAGHTVEIMASGRASEFLGKRFADVNRIHGLHMILEENRVRRGKTLWSNVLGGVRGLPGNIKAYFELIGELEPEVVISDFESWTYLYGKNHRLPILSIDNMQLIHRCELPADVIEDHRVAFQLTKTFIKAKLPFCDAYYVTSFARPPVRKPDTWLFPPILRPEILAARPADGDHLLVYQSGPNEALAAALARTGIEARIYGMRPGDPGEARDGALWYRPFSEASFIDDLATCRGVIAAGGFTLMGEAVYLHKPMLSVPLTGQFEQVLNARFLEREGYGMAADDLDDPSVLPRFLERLPGCAAALAAYHQDGNREILAAVDGFLARVAAGHG
ncbi:MAG: teichoic acid biosynthesis protein [Kofleriaceae bacterium]|nr:teichoic acid biosynthesis protein [Myxococcales bacterium]MCB9565132.1 teichoic acid biosynthesis protein [Kofleriaceae bacterium]MCB9570798.1 teichoic acid biosynthesis protein [Kofleriaceae bacterium]